jgi:hypothetical protein
MLTYQIREPYCEIEIIPCNINEKKLKTWSLINQMLSDGIENKINFKKWSEKKTKVISWSKLWDWDKLIEDKP